MDGWIEAKDLLYICACIRGINLTMPAKKKKERKTKFHLSFYSTCSFFSFLAQPIMFV